MMQAMPQYQKEIQMYLNHMHIVEDCQKQYSKNVEKLCKVEQDLATGATAEGERMKEPMKNVIPILLDQNVEVSHIFIYQKFASKKPEISKIDYRQTG